MKLTYPGVQLSTSCVRTEIRLGWALLVVTRSEEHTSELQSRLHLVCRLLLGSKEHTSELQSRLHLVCRLLLEKKENRYARAVPRHDARLPMLRLKTSQARASVIMSITTSSTM